VTGALAEATHGQHLFILESRNDDDALLRVLGCFAVQQARLVETRAVADGPMLSMRIVARGLSPSRAELLRRRLCELPLAAQVSVGWRGDGAG
jgi:hypothetical protein